VTLLDTEITEAHRAIDLLEERRSALIFAAVTGKIDVRDYYQRNESQESQGWINYYGQFYK
jgi:hypothetical protein